MSWFNRLTDKAERVVIFGSLINMLHGMWVYVAGAISFLGGVAGWWAGLNAIQIIIVVFCALVIAIMFINALHYYKENVSSSTNDKKPSSSDYSTSPNQTVNNSSHSCSEPTTPLVDFSMIEVKNNNSENAEVNLNNVNMSSNNFTVSMPSETARQHEIMSDTNLQPVVGERFTRESGLVILTGKSFTDCVFTEGADIGFDGAPYKFTNCQFDESVTMHSKSLLVKNTINFLKFMGQLGSLR